MLDLNWSDVVSTLQSLQNYLIAIGVILVLAVIATVACLKLAKHQKFMIRSQVWIAALIAIVVVVNIICTGPMYTLLSLVSGTGTLTQETSDAAVLRVEEIADEGIVLLENQENLLPLAPDSNVNVFGWASTNPVYGGTGSGALNDAYHIVTLLEGLQNAGFKTNTELRDFYTNYRSDRPAVAMFEQDWTLPEPAADTYSDTLINSAKEFSDTALIVFSRPGAEQVDLPKDVTGLTYTENSDSYQDFPAGRHYLELSQSEADMVELVCSNFDNVVVICNSSNTMDLSFVDDYPQIKSVVWCPGTGNNGFNSLGRILNGTVNPSGKTADTFIRDFTQAPYWNNFGLFVYDNMTEFRIADSDPYVPGTMPHFVNYVEDIYVGYKYWETAAAEGFIHYDEMVQYPFGHGLSYTSFTQEMGAISESNGTINFDVTVTNTGSVAGKDVVEVYYNPPYTNGGIEKASSNLVAFDKTDMLEPGASQTLTLSFHVEDMASYDMSGAGGYVLEAGDYIISINQNSHDIIDSQVYTVDADIEYTNGRSTDLAAPVNLFDFAKGEIEYLSRADGFANFATATAAPSMSMPEADKALFVNNSNYVIPTDPNAAMPTTGAGNGMTIQELRGADYDDPRWETLLDNLTIDEMNNMIALGGYQTAPAASIGKVATTDCDGPAALKLSDTARQMFGTTLEAGDIRGLLQSLRREKFLLAAESLAELSAPLLRLMEQPFDAEKSFRNFSRFLTAPARNLHIVQKQLQGLLSQITRQQLRKLSSTMELFTKENPDLVFYAMEDKRGGTMLCAVAADMTAQLRATLWNQERSAILTSGTLAVGSDFYRFKEETGLLADGRVTESVSASPFDYKANYLLYLPLHPPEQADSGYFDTLAAEIAALLDACWGHALVLFTSYAAMSAIKERLAEMNLPWAVFTLGRNAVHTTQQFKASPGSVLLATGAAWEGFDFPGDCVSLLVIPRLPFSRPDALKEKKRAEYPSLRAFIRAVVVPEMQIKLKQGFGRAIRTETDTCVVAILDERAAPGQRHHGAMLDALPELPITSSLEDVVDFIYRAKGPDYFREGQP